MTVFALLWSDCQPYVPNLKSRTNSAVKQCRLYVRIVEYVRRFYIVEDWPPRNECFEIQQAPTLWQKRLSFLPNASDLITAQIMGWLLNRGRETGRQGSYTSLSTAHSLIRVHGAGQECRNFQLPYSRCLLENRLSIFARKINTVYQFLPTFAVLTEDLVTWHNGQDQTENQLPARKINAAARLMMNIEQAE